MKIFENPIVNLSINTALVYGVAYLGRAYLQINPLHAALFSLGTFVAHSLGKKLAKGITNESYYSTFSGRVIRLISMYVPAMLAINYRFFSPLQAIATMGLTSLVAEVYFAIATRSPWNI